MKPVFSTLLLLCFTAVSAFSQTSINITLNEDTPTREVSIPSFNMSEVGRFVFTKGETDANGNVDLVVEIENNSSEYMFLLFNKYYGQNEIRRHRPRIVFSKFFPGNSIEKVEGPDLTEIKIFPFYDHRFSQNNDNVYRFPKTSVKEGSSKAYTIPLYLAKRKNTLFGYRIELWGIIDLNFNITIEQTDKDYDRIKASCDSIDDLLDRLGEEKPFCTHRSHQPTYNKQIEPHVERIGSLQSFINQKLNNPKVAIGKAKRELYEKLQDELERNLEYLTKEYEHDCGRHNVHNCIHCKLSLEQIYRKMNSIYIELTNAEAQEFNAKKKALLKEADEMYRCCTSPTCAKHASQWRKGGQIKQKIVERYEQLQKL